MSRTIVTDLCMQCKTAVVSGTDFLHLLLIQQDNLDDQAELLATPKPSDNAHHNLHFFAKHKIVRAIENQLWRSAKGRFVNKSSTKQLMEDQWTHRH